MSFKNILSAALPALALASPNPLTASVLGQLPPPALFENIAVRPNGDLLSTLIIGDPDIYTVSSPSSPQHRSFHRLTSIPEVQALSGVAQLHTHDNTEVFVVTGGNFSSTPPQDPTIGSFSAWTLTFPSGEHDVQVARLSDLGKETELPNGVTTVPGAVLIADSARGMVGRLDIETSTFTDDEFSFPEMLTTPDFELGIGINGVKVHNGHLYFSNTATATIYRVSATPDGHLVPGARPELVADVHLAGSAIDDFVFDAEGNIYAATNLENTILYVDVATGESSVAVGSQESWDVAGCSAVAFGRGRSDANTLYGSATSTTIGNVTEGGRILAVEI